ncbi:hypothetical protein [Staphylococcus aureus]|uniref:hypothetical protein n=1 Tax=Staphylococcus aureus TaxID=1280 RepID=UPI000CD2179F|nr:hypothetical protein [Staphylococcus aureus]
MTRPTREELLSYFKKYGVERVDSITDDESAILHFRTKAFYYKKENKKLSAYVNKLEKHNKELEKKASAWDRYCKSVEKDLINEFGNDDERVKFGMELNNKMFMEDDTNE